MSAKSVTTLDLSYAIFLHCQIYFPLTFSYSHTGISVLRDRGFDSSPMESSFRSGWPETYHDFGVIRIIGVDPELWSFSDLFVAGHKVLNRRYSGSYKDPK